MNLKNSLIATLFFSIISSTTFVGCLDLSTATAEYHLCQPCTSDDQCGYRCDTNLSLCYHKTAENAEFCLTIDAGIQKDSGEQQTDGGTTGPTTKLGDGCLRYPDDPNNPLNPPDGSWCGYPDGYQYQGSLSGLIYKSRKPSSLQLFTSIAATCKFYFVNENTPQGSKMFSSVEFSARLQKGVVKDFDPTIPSYIFVEGCGSDYTMVTFGGYINNIPKRGPTLKSTDVSTVSGGIMVDGSQKTTGMLIAVTDI